MAKSFSINKNQTGILITVLVLIFLGACYFFIYVPNNEKTVQERRFRCLQNIDNNIHSKIENSILFINTLLNAYPNNYPTKDSLNKKDTLNKRIAQYPKNNFTLLSAEVKQEVLKNGTVVVKGNAPTNVEINVDLNSRQITVWVSKTIAQNQNSKDTLKIGIRFGIEQFAKQLLPGDVFDNYIIFDKKSKIYETFPSGLSYKKKDSLLEVKGDVYSPGVRSLKIGGTDYKVFSQPVNISGNNEWIVSGLVSNNNYQREKTQLPLWIVLLLLTAAITMIVSLPWIKLYHMGNRDKLTIRDGIASVLVSMILMSLLFFIFFKYSFSFNNAQNIFSEKKYSKSTYPRNSLATKITRSFETELDTVYCLLEKCDDTLAHDGNHPLRDRDYDTVLKKEARNLGVQQVFWLNDSGLVKHSWTTSIIIAINSDFSGRNYFRSTINNQPNKTTSPQFFLDQVVSRTTGVFTSVIAKRSKNSKYAVTGISFTAKSLDATVMPDGYQFAIINDTGKVLYHSLPAKNLNENLKNEFADSSQLVSCIRAKSDTSFTTEYFGRQYNIKIKPIKGMPYFTVVLEDLEYNDARDTEAYSFTLSMLICLLIFMVFQFSLVFFVSSKRSFFKNQLFDTSWIGPKTTSHHEYNLAIIANLITIAFLIGFFNLESFLEYFFIILFSITFTSLFLNFIFAIKYSNENLYKFRFKRIATGWLCAFVLVINIAACSTLEGKHIFLLFLYEFLLIFVCLIFYRRGLKLFEYIRNYKIALQFPWTYTHSFSLMAATRLIITSGIPVAFFFVYSFNYEQNLDTRYKQLKFAEDLTRKVFSSKIIDSKPGSGKTLASLKAANPDSVKIDSIRNGLKYTSGVYYDGLFINSFRYTTHKDSTRHYNKEDLSTTEILSAFRFHKNNLALMDNDLIFPSVENDAFFNNLTNEKNDSNYSTRTYYNIKNSNKYIRISSLNINYPCPEMPFLILLIGLLLGFYYVIHNIIRKLFALDLPSIDQWKERDEKLLSDEKLNNLLFIVGSPGSGKLSSLQDKISAGIIKGKDGSQLICDKNAPPKNNVFIADMILISPENGEDDPEWKKCKREALKEYAIVVLNHFEYNIKDIKTNSIKLNLLELLMHKGASKIIIISTVHPVSFLDSFNQQQDNPIPENELERWHVLLGHFRIVIEPLKILDNIPHSLLENILMDETRYTHFLNNMQATTIANLPHSDSFREMDRTSDSMVFKLQLTAQYFYTYIWQSLTKEEKFLLYDLAEDGLVNPYDDFNLTMLIYKGLIIKPKGTLMLFNKSFRNFILTAIGNTEAARIKDQVKDNGSWGNLKTPINLAILAILIFLFASQQEAYSRIITYITALSAGVPVVLKVSSMFGNSTQKTS
ncbi:MAG: cache domain-containing protein [Mucilaginibacter sp.]